MSDPVSVTREDILGLARTARNLGLHAAEKRAELDASIQEVKAKLEKLDAALAALGSAGDA
jgi:hypothetical protein